MIITPIFSAISGFYAIIKLLFETVRVEHFIWPGLRSE